MKKNLKIIIPLTIIVVVALVLLFKPAKKTSPESSPVPARKVENINQLNIKERPYVTLIPRSDGKEVILGIDKVLNAAKVEYEMEYQAEALIQGVFGSIDFTKDSLPIAKNLLFGSCSKGKCKYDDGVTGGSLTLRFDGGDQPYVLKTDFNLQNMFDRQGIFITKDAKASLDVGKTGLAAGTFVIVASTLGLPEAVEGEILAGPYAFLASSAQSMKSATVTIQSKDDLNGAKLLFWNGKAYTELTATVSGAKISAPVTALGTFVVVR